MPKFVEQKGSTAWLIAGIALLCAALVWGGLRWPLMGGNPTGVTPDIFALLQPQASPPPHPLNALEQVLRLVAAALIGLVVTEVHKRSRRKKKLSRALSQAQVLLCISGALMMIIIGDHLARAFGVAGAASIIRFRTPVKNPKDTTVLFLLIALGMASGLGAYAVAGLATFFICTFLVILDRMSPPADQKPRVMALELVANSPEFPTAHVLTVFTRNRLISESREIIQSKETSVKYQVTLAADVSLDELSRQLMGNGASGIKSIAWGKAKK
ncbi:MAG: DUF4956 domain-containing protein [Gammaproteobacteria bacterium]